MYSTYSYLAVRWLCVNIYLGDSIFAGGGAEANRRNIREIS